MTVYDLDLKNKRGKKVLKRIIRAFYFRTTCLRAYECTCML